MSGKPGGGRAVAGIVLRAMGYGVVMMIVLPVALALGALAVGHLAGACGPGSSGGCEMGAAGLALYALLPGFVIGAGLSVFRDLRDARA